MVHQVIWDPVDNEGHLNRIVLERYGCLRCFIFTQRQVGVPADSRSAGNCRLLIADCRLEFDRCKFRVAGIALRYRAGEMQDSMQGRPAVCGTASTPAISAMDASTQSLTPFSLASAPPSNPQLQFFNVNRQPGVNVIPEHPYGMFSGRKHRKECLYIFIDSVRTDEWIFTNKDAVYIDQEGAGVDGLHRCAAVLYPDMRRN